MSARSRDAEGHASAGEDGGADPFDALLREAARVSAVAPDSVALLAPGTVLAGGRLSIVNKIGRGGMGVVYEAYDARRRSRVACKTLSRLDAASVYRLKNEFRALADVTHPNLVQLYELFADGESWFFTMELVDGERFDRWVRPGAAGQQQGCDEGRLRAALPQLLRAICAIHAAGKLHRDLKPSNVLVTPEGRVVVLDFGLSVDPELGGVGQTLADDSVSGTPAYMAPEQAAGRAATTASDFYALGAMLFEALTGRLPFGGRAHEMLVDKQRGDAPRASTLAQGLPEDLVQLCAELLAREPSARPNARALAARVGSRAGAAGHSRAAAEGQSAALDLLGREPELQALREAFARTLQGEPVLLFVTGESGMGKSALCEAFARELRVQGRATVLAGRCYERENVPFKGFDALVDDLSRFLRRLPAEDAAAVLPREAYALARIFPVLGRIDVVARAPRKAVADAQELKRRAVAAFAELLGRLRDRGPLVLLLDDAQWLDQDSVGLVRALLLQPEPVPMLLVCAHRSEGADANALLRAVRQGARDSSRIRVAELGVGPLPRAELRALGRRLLPRTAPAAIVDAIAGEAQGSPYFVGALARAATARGLEQPAPSLADALALHVASLPAAARRMLSLLAVGGQSLPVDLIVDAVGDANGHADLDRLRAEQLVRVSIGDDGQRSVECYHDQIGEQLAAGLERSALQELALALAGALGPRAEANPELAARLLALGGRPREAAAHTGRAAEAALAALAFERAAKLFADALQHGEFSEARAQALRVGLADALALAGRGPAAGEAYLAAVAHARGDDAHALEQKAAEQYLLAGDLERGRVLLDRALRRVGHRLPQSLPGALAGIAWSRTRLRLRGLAFTPRADQDAATLRELEVLRAAVICLMRSDVLRGADFCARYVQRALDAGHAVEAARALPWEILMRSMSDAPIEQVDAAIAACEALVEQTGDAQARMTLTYWRANHRSIRLGQHDQALADFDHCLELLDADSIHTAAYDRCWAAYHRSTCLAFLGRLAESVELASAHLEDARARGDQTAFAALMQTTCFGLVAVGQTDRAQRLIDEVESRLRPGEITMPDLYWFNTLMVTAIYDGRARERWIATATHRARYFSSWQGRVLFASANRAFVAGMAAAAARSTEDAAERRAMLREAHALAKGAPPKGAPGVKLVPRDVLLACLAGDRATATARLRRWIPSPDGPLLTQVFRRRLGELLGDAEGAALIAEADAFMRAGGVVDPARFSAAVAPGLELQERS